MDLTFQILAALQGDDSAQHYSQIVQLKQQHSLQEFQQATTELNSENREKLRRVTQKMFDESGDSQDLILALSLSPLSDLEQWLQHYFGKRHLEHLTTQELLQAQELMQDLVEFEDLLSSSSESAPLANGEIQELKTVKIRLDGNTQPREFTDETLIREYQEDLEAGAEFPPIVVFYDGHDYWLADGFHRYFAHTRAERSIIKAEIRLGSQRDAIFYSVSVNSKHGRRRSNADKRRAVLTLLQDPEWSVLSDRQIAKQCSVHHVTVGKLRAELSGDLSRYTSESSPPGMELSGDLSRYTSESSPLGAELSGDLSKNSPPSEKAPPNENLSGDLSRYSPSSDDTSRIRTVIRNGKPYTMRTGNINKERTKNAQEGDNPTWLRRSQQPEEITRTQCANFTYDCGCDPEAIARTLARQLSTRRKFKAVLDEMNQLAESPREILASIIPDYDPDVDW